MLALWSGFVACTLAIVYSGIRLSKYGDIAASAMMMTAIAIIGLTYRAEKKRLFIAWDSLGIVIVYIINLMLLYMMRGGLD